MSEFWRRTSAPDVSIPYYKSSSFAGGLNDCLVIDWNTGAVMPNCVGYTWGRVYELLGSRPTCSRGDGTTWWTYPDGYERGSEPRLGAIACFDSSTFNHVAIVEYIGKEFYQGQWTDILITSDSIYGGVNWQQTGCRKVGNNYYSYIGGTPLPNYAKIIGFIYPPYDWYKKKMPIWMMKKGKENNNV